MKEGCAGIADVVEALAALRPNRTAAELIAAMCGFSLAPEQLAPPSPALPVHDVPETALAADTAQSSGDASDQPLPPSVNRLRPVRQERIAAAAGDPLAGSGPRTGGATPAFEGLLTLRDGAELLRFAASVPMYTEAIDVERVAHQLAQARPLTELPRLRVPSLALGAQVLVDVGESMQPFLEDQQQLLQRLASNLRAGAEIRYFADDPQRGAGPERRRGSWKQRYALPRSGTPVIALTDLGCGFPRRPTATRAWLRLAEQLRRRQSRLVVFAPVRPGRIPLALRRAADLVFWDRSARRRNVMQLVETPP